MIVTEEEAKTRVCQEAISAQLPDDKVADASRCIGSVCMAWRFVRQVEASIQDCGHTQQYSPMPIGYCGKAGKP
jgi:hypothetical protein